MAKDDLARLRPGAVRKGGRIRAVAMLIGVATVAVVFLGAILPNWLHNPFTEKIVDRTGPALLESITDMSEYHAASGTFQIVVDLEKDTKYVPSMIKGERTTFVAVGSVDGVVDLSALAEGAVNVGPDGRVTITVPQPRLDGTAIDTEHSYVAARQRGLLDRVGSLFSDNPTSERDLVLAAEAKMQDAALQSDLLARAEDNTRVMLEGMAKALGFTEVTVVFVAPPPVS